MDKADGSGLRYNIGKLRYDLVPHNSHRDFVRVLTRGAKKYSDDNWRKGMPWMDVVASLKRHLEAFCSGEDYDKESHLLHIAHVMANASFLNEYYYIYPEGDNRIKTLTKIAIEEKCLQQLNPEELPFDNFVIWASDENINNNIDNNNDGKFSKYEIIRDCSYMDIVLCSAKTYENKKNNVKPKYCLF
jgi:hypothetical protein